MIFKFAFRNLLRKKKRTFLTTLSIFFAAIIVMVGQGWVNGMFDMMTDNFVNNQTGNIRISTAEFESREKFMPVDELMYDYQPVVEKVKQLDYVERVEERIRFGIMLGKDERTVYAMGMGLNMNDNKFDLENKIVDGQLNGNGILMGYELAKKLDVKVGDKLLLATKTSEGGLNGIKVEVSGMVNMQMNTLNEKVFFISLDNAKKLLKINNAATEILVFTKNHNQSLQVKKEIEKIIPDDFIALTYKQQLGSFIQFMDVEKNILYFIFAVILFLASFVIINTMIMAVFERLREIGTLKSLGFSDKQIYWNFTIEGAIIGAIGAITGTIVGYLFLMYLNKHGVDISSVTEGNDFPVNFIMRPSIKPKLLIITILMGIIIPALASMFPARYTKKFMPAQMLRKV